ncbi:MAG: hypothetical protein RL701_6372 [Pseudomonadota bacterium]|jgi:pimeloyl-ACP methyl ester carboxylesterase
MSIRKLYSSVWIAAAFVSACSNSQLDTDVTPIGAIEALRERSLSFEVKLRETGSATIHASVFTSSLPSGGATLLAVPGLAETGKTFEPIARAVFADRALRRRVGRVIAIDLVGRGESSPPRNLPNGALFGELTIEDNVSVVLQAVAALRERGYAPRFIAGHSMGGLAVQAVQQTLLAQGSSLAALGIRDAILLAPVPPHGRPWLSGPGADLSPFIKQSAELGGYLELSPEAFIAQAYGTLTGALAANAPTPAEVTSAGYIALEPLVTVLQLVESPIPLPDGTTLNLPRPSVNAGAFAPNHHTNLTLFSFSQDLLVPAGVLGDLYTYLTAEPAADGYRPIAADDAVHNTFTSHPTLITEAFGR